jgi:hypothetical protein
MHHHTMGSLPVELQQIVFGSLASLEDLRSVRLLGKCYCKIVSPRLFENITVTSRPANFHRLMSLCNSQLAKHVRYLHYNLFTIHFIQRDEWDASVKSLLQTHQVCDDQDDDIDCRPTSYEEYKCCCYEQLAKDEDYH